MFFIFQCINIYQWKNDILTFTLKQINCGHYVLTLKRRVFVVRRQLFIEQNNVFLCIIIRF